MSAAYARLGWDEVPSRTEPAVREVLRQHRPQLVMAFDAELERASTSQQHQHAVRHWWALVVGLLHPDPEAEQAHARLLAGEQTQLVASPL